VKKRLGLAFALIVLVAAAYHRVWQAGFIWDDDAHLTQNVCIVGPAGLKEIWTTAQAVYYPLVLTTFWVVHKFAGLNPLPYHSLNVLLHGISAVILWRVLRNLNVRGAWLGAALWALHPVMVQSVAWITEMKNTQSCVFYLLSVLCFLKWTITPAPPTRWLQFAASLLFAAMAMTSKASTVVLPAVLGISVWWQNGRWRWRDVAALMPFVVLSAAASAWTIWEQKFHAGALGNEWAQTLPERLIIAGRDLGFYLQKLAWPEPLIFMYPRWRIDATQWLTYLPIAAAVAVLLALWFLRKTRVRPVLFAAAYFVIALLPVLGFFDVYFFRYSFVSDHFQYLASIGPLALAGAAITSAAESIPGRRVVLPLLAAFLLAALGTLTWWQTRIYLDPATLWRATLAKNPESWMAHYELARGLRERGDIDGAVREYEQGLAIWPDYAEAHYNLAGIFLDQGDVDRSIAEYEKALRLKPRDADAHNNLGGSLLMKGQLDRAITEFLTALALRPDNGEAEQNLGQALLQRGRVDDAVQHLRKAVEINPADPVAHGRLGTALVRANRTPEAVVEFERAIALDNRDVAARSSLAWILATSSDDSVRNGQRALQLAQEAVQLSSTPDALALHSLAAAFAETGQSREAVDTAERALRAAETQGNTALADTLRSELALYELGLPYRVWNR
jgi:tetratricopeptide (TPR) repeat protein